MQVLNQQYSHMAPKLHNDKRVRACFPTPVAQPFRPSVPKHWFIRFLCNLQGISKPHLPFAVLVFNKWRDLSLNILTGLELLAEGGSEQCMWGKSRRWTYHTWSMVGAKGKQSSPLWTSHLQRANCASVCQCRRHRFDLLGGKIPWRRKWQPTVVFLLGKFHGQRNLAVTVLGITKSQTQLKDRAHMWELKLLRVASGSLTRDWTQPPCIGSAEPSPLDHQGSPL